MRKLFPQKNMSHHNPLLTAKHATEAIEKMKKLPEKKDPILAGIIGCVFGAVGVGLYFQSWTDFFVCIGLFLLLSICLPAIGIIPGWLAAGVYGYYRAETSNEKHH